MRASPPSSLLSFTRSFSLSRSFSLFRSLSLSFNLPPSLSPPPPSRPHVRVTGRSHRANIGPSLRHSSVHEGSADISDLDYIAANPLFGVLDADPLGEHSRARLARRVRVPLLPDAEADGTSDGGEVNDVAGAALLEVGEELVYELKLGEMGGG